MRAHLVWAIPAALLYVAPAVADYTFTALPDPAGVNSLEPTGINNHGYVSATGGPNAANADEVDLAGISTTAPPGARSGHRTMWSITARPV